MSVSPEHTAAGSRPLARAASASALEAQVLRYAHLIANGVLRGDLQAAVHALGNCTTAVGLYVGLPPEAKSSAAELDAIADQLHSVAAAIEQLEESL